MWNSFKNVDNEICRQASINRGAILLDCIFDNQATINLNSASEPVVSIVIVSYNAPELLATTLTSLAGQSSMNHSPFETIIVDNASSEETVQLLEHVVGARVVFNAENLGFGGGCNLGAAAARGGYLLFLNPDMDLMPGSIDAMVEAITSNDGVGIVGGRLIFPNGQLQEAGAHFKNDEQMTHPYLRGAQHPNTPEANYQHATGYVSGAMLMIKKDLFDKLSGFDPIYSPAYFEDTDLCVRCSRLGYTVLYDPRATAIHFESATSKDRAAVTTLLDRNRGAFRTRHAEWIFSAGESVSDLELRNFSPTEFRILYIDDQVPHVDAGSGYPRSNAIVNHFASHGYFVSIFPLHRGETIKRNKYRDLSRRVEVLGGENATPLIDIIDQRSGYYDILWVSRPHNIDIVTQMFNQKGKSMRDFVRSSVVFDAEALFALRDAQKCFVQNDAVLGRNIDREIWRELQNYVLADHVICVNEGEKALFEKYGLANTRVLGHALDVIDDTPGFASRSGFVFVGALFDINSPNVDSLLWFKERAWPLIRAKSGENSKLTIVGAVSSDVRKALDDDGIVFTGKVDDISPYVNAARVMIAPTRYAAGIPHKAHEAISRGLPCVITPILSHQLGWPSGVGHIAADWLDPELFADAAIRLANQEKLWLSVRDRGFVAIKKECSSENFSRTLRDICEWTLVSS